MNPVQRTAPPTLQPQVQPQRPQTLIQLAPRPVTLAQPAASAQPVPQPPTAATANPPSGVIVQPRRLTLSKEQMLEAQEMFKTANKVTRPEKALILGFMAGSRDNPCPHLGNFKLK